MNLKGSFELNLEESDINKVLVQINKYKPFSIIIVAVYQSQL